MHVNKAELAQILGCSLPTVAAYVSRYGDRFPVLKRGGLGQDWLFDHEAVVTFLADEKAKETEADESRRIALRQFALPLAGHNGGPELEGDLALRPADLLAMAKLRKMQRDEAYECGRLVVASQMEEALKEVLRGWNGELHSCVKQFAKDYGLAEDVASALEVALVGCQRRFVSFMQSRFTAGGDKQTPSLFEVAAD